jgi:hypothetical protein
VSEVFREGPPRNARHAAVTPSFVEGGLTGAECLTYFAIRMTHLNATPVTMTAHLWWRGYPLAARWRD